jgi:hypothetical protein
MDIILPKERLFRSSVNLLVEISKEKTVLGNKGDDIS